MAVKKSTKQLRPTKAEIVRVQKVLRDKFTSEDRDFAFAALIVSNQLMMQAIEQIIEKHNLALTKKEKHEIERKISIGPKWLNYSIKLRDKK